MYCDCSCRFLLFFILIVSDLSHSIIYLKWKAHIGKVCDVQFGSPDEEKVYSLGEDSMFFLWVTSAEIVPLRGIHLHNYQHPPQLTWKETVRTSTIHVTHPATGRNKLFGLCFGYKYILISSVEGKVVYKVKECNLGSNIFTFCVWFQKQF